MTTTAAVVHFAGALLGIALISRLPVWILQAWREKSLLRLFAAHLFTYVIVAVISAYAQARGVDPQWKAAFIDFALPALIVFLIDIALMFKRDSGSEGLQAHWFMHSAGKQSGPVPAEAVTAALADGSLKSSDWIWRAGFTEWMQISSVDLASKDGMPPPVAADPQASRNYLRRHWQGALSLPRSYWIGGLLIAALFVIPYLLLMRLTLTDHPRLIGAAVTGLWLTLLVAMLWLSVGIFRSADHYARAHPARHWGSAAKLSVILGGLMVLSIFARLGVPQLRDFAEAVSGSSPQTLYALELRRDNTELALTGPMDSGLSEAVARSLMDHPRLATLSLDSKGGDLNEADKLRTIILSRGLNTYVPATCADACVTVFAAGKTRWLSRSAFLALHRPVIAGATPDDLAAAAAKMKAFLESRGIAASFIDKGLAATQEAAFRPSHAEMFDARFATSYATDAEVAKGGVPVEEIRDAEAQVNRTALYQVLKEKHPKAHAELLAIVHDRILKAESPARMRKRVALVIAPIVNDSLSSAAEPALLAFYQMATDEAEAFAKVDARSCEAFLKGDTGGFDAALLPLSLQEREFQATADLIRSAGSYAGKPIEQSEVMGALAKVVTAAQTKGFTLADFQQAIQFKLDPARNCQGMILLFRTLFVMDEPDRTALLRYMAQQATTL